MHNALYIMMYRHYTFSFVVAIVVKFEMMEAARDTSIALNSAMLEVMLTKVTAACSGDFSRSYIK